MGLELVPTGPMSFYRNLAQQLENLYGRYLAGGNLAAKPGSSNHGWGLARSTSPPRRCERLVDRIGEPYGWAKRWSGRPVGMAAPGLPRRGVDRR